jgi:hypothetical protein
MRRRLRVFLLLFLGAGALANGARANEQPVPAELLQAKTVFIQKGMVYQQKHDPTGEASNIEPCKEEIGKWGRYKVVTNPREADLILRVSNRDDRHSTIAGSASLTGSITTGSMYTVIDVIQPGSGKVLYSVAHNWSKSWSTKTAATGAVKDLRKRVEETERVASDVN